VVALGIAEPTARALIEQHGQPRVVDALDAVDTLGDGEVRRRAGWVVSAIRQGWDLEGLLAERRQLEARYARWERERAERDRAAARWRARESTAAGWRAALSTALDDQQLAIAVARVTTPVAGLGRRSLPVVRAQLRAWAVTTYAATPDRPLSEVLAGDLVGPHRRVVVPSLEGPLPPLPGHVGEPEGDLTDRLTRLLARRPDLSHPGIQLTSGRRSPGLVRLVRGSVMAADPSRDLSRESARERVPSPHETREFANAVEYAIQLAFVVAGVARWRTAYGLARPCRCARPLSDGRQPGRP
jgi:hypothetical protein